MSVSYKKLWKLLIDHDMKKKDLAKVADISNYTITKMSKGENVTVETLGKICAALNCVISRIMILMKYMKINFGMIFTEQMRWQSWLFRIEKGLSNSNLSNRSLGSKIKQGSCHPAGAFYLPPTLHYILKITVISDII